MSEPKKNNFYVLRKLLVLAKPYWGYLGGAALLAIIIAPLAPYRSKLIQTVVDEHIVKGDIAGLKFYIIALIGLLVLEASLMYIFTNTTNWLGQTIIKELRVKVFQKITSFRLTYFDTTPIGTSTTRTINDLETINSVFSEGLIAIVADMLTLILVFTFMFITSWKLTLVCMVTAPFLGLSSYFFKEAVKKSFQSVRSQVANMNAFLQERISGMRIVQIFNVEKEELEKFQDINQKLTKANVEGVFAYAVFFPVVEILSAAALGLMVWYGAGGVIDGHITLGVLVAFPLYISMLFRPIRMLADKFNTLQMGLVAAERVFAILDDTDNLEKNGAIESQKFNGAISFQNVDFSYDGENQILKNVNFEVKPETTLAIVGSTGSGKTTIISILNRFYEIQKGSIKIDGVDIRDYNLTTLRGRIAVVLQDVFLFSGSVLENITLRDKSISREQVIEASKLIGAHEFIEKLPDGYDYNVMERGATLSMGQRQLISFVRALVFNPDILILDEATSSIDPETERVIQFAIEKLIAKRTSIIIAHRLSTIRHANNIMVLDKGEVKEFGSHEQLLTLENGHYRELYEQQVQNWMQEVPEV
jgi:ATP-binding cassette, subfamily B, multidrug efflux pump